MPMPEAERQQPTRLYRWMVLGQRTELCFWHQSDNCASGNLAGPEFADLGSFFVRRLAKSAIDFGRLWQPLRSGRFALLDSRVLCRDADGSETSRVHRQ